MDVIGTNYLASLLGLHKSHRGFHIQYAFLGTPIACFKFKYNISLDSMFGILIIEALYRGCQIFSILVYDQCCARGMLNCMRCIGGLPDARAILLLLRLHLLLINNTHIMIGTQIANAFGLNRLVISQRSRIVNITS